MRGLGRFECGRQARESMYIEVDRVREIGYVLQSEDSICGSHPIISYLILPHVLISFPHSNYHSRAFHPFYCQNLATELHAY